MTTILFDPIERALYADGRITNENMIRTNSAKKIETINIPKLGKCLITYAGVGTEILHCKKYLMGLVGKSESENEANCLFIDKSGIAYIYYSGDDTYNKLEDQNICYTDGSGYQFAIGAYKASGSGFDAIEAAKQCDVYSGGITTKAYFYKGLPVFEVTK